MIFNWSNEIDYVVLCADRNTFYVSFVEARCWIFCQQKIAFFLLHFQSHRTQTEKILSNEGIIFNKIWNCWRIANLLIFSTLSILNSVSKNYLFFSYLQYMVINNTIMKACSSVADWIINVTFQFFVHHSTAKEKKENYKTKNNVYAVVR